METTHYNPGENVKGQLPRARVHHTGRVDVDNYIEDPIARSNSQSKRIKTIKEKIKEVSTMSGTRILMKVVTETGRVETVKTANWIEEETAQPNAEAAPVPEEDLNAVYPACVTPESSTTNEKRKRNYEEANEDKCKICNQGSMRKGKGDIWVQCEFMSHGLPCTYWVHSVCTGFLVDKERDLDKIKFYCPVHIKTFKKLCKSVFKKFVFTAFLHC